MKRSVSWGSCPSRPTMITRRTQGRARFLRRRARHTSRKGRSRRLNTTSTIVVSRTRNEESRATPAPGPMYARRGWIKKGSSAAKPESYAILRNRRKNAGQRDSGGGIDESGSSLSPDPIRKADRRRLGAAPVGHLDGHEDAGGRGSPRGHRQPARRGRGQ